MNGSPVNNHPGQTLADRLAGMTVCLCCPTVSTMFRLGPSQIHYFRTSRLANVRMADCLPPTVAVAPASPEPLRLCQPC